MPTGVSRCLPVNLHHRETCGGARLAHRRRESENDASQAGSPRTRRISLAPMCPTRTERLLQIRVVLGLDVRQWSARQIAVRLALAIDARLERQVVAKHVAVALSFTEQLATALLENEVGVRLAR